jgi:hypothetical protein
VVVEVASPTPSVTHRIQVVMSLRVIDGLCPYGMELERHPCKECGLFGQVPRHPACTCGTSLKYNCRCTGFCCCGLISSSGLCHDCRKDEQEVALQVEALAARELEERARKKAAAVTAAAKYTRPRSAALQQLAAKRQRDASDQCEVELAAKRQTQEIAEPSSEEPESDDSDASLPDEVPCHELVMKASMAYSTLKPDRYTTTLRILLHPPLPCTARYQLHSDLVHTKN